MVGKSLHELDRCLRLPIDFHELVRCRNSPAGAMPKKAHARGQGQLAAMGYFLRKGDTDMFRTFATFELQQWLRSNGCLDCFWFLGSRPLASSSPMPAMTPAHFDLVIRRLLASGAPKEAWERMETGQI